MRIGLIGLGTMGAAIARTLTRKSHSVAAYDLRPDRESALAKGARYWGSIAELASACTTVLLSLPSSREVEAVVRGPGGILAHARPGTLVIDTSTSDPESTRALAIELAAAGHSLVDAPISGGASGADAGTLGMMVGGAPADIARARPILDAIAGKIVVVGPAGTGHAAKLVNNLLTAQHLLTTAEALKLGRAAGLDPAQLLAAINVGSGRSSASEICFPKWVMSGKYDSGFSMGLMRKDVRLAMALAERVGVKLPLGAAAAEQWEASADTQADSSDSNRIADHVRDAS